MPDQTEQDTAAAAQIAMTRRAYELAVEVGDEDFVVITEEFGAVLAALDSAQQRANRAEDAAQRECVHCEQPMTWVDCPTGGWWAHVQHPADGHDARTTAEADRDRLATRVTELETELQRLTNPTPEQMREMQAEADRQEAAYWEAAARSELRRRARHANASTDTSGADESGDETTDGSGNVATASTSERNPA